LDSGENLNTKKRYFLKNINRFFSVSPTVFFILSVFTYTLSLQAKSLLYEVRSPTATVYVMGSIHLAKPELYPLDKMINKAYAQSDVLVLELDPSSDQSVREMKKAMEGLGRYPSGHTIQTELSSRTYNRLQRYLDKVKIPLQEVEVLRPWVIVLHLSMVEMTRLGYSPELGLDQHFLGLAKADKKSIIELETAKEQMALLSKEDKTFQDKLLFYTLESMHEIEPMLNEMFHYWKIGDAKAFDKIMSLPLNDDPSLADIYDDIIIKRNYTMAQKIEGFLQTKKTYFVVVGAGHVVGEEGIVSLLKKSGYKLKQH